MAISRLKHKQPGYIQGPAEPPRRRFPLGKYIYIIVITCIVVWALNWAVRRFLFIEGKAMLEPTIIEIKSKIPTRIVEIKFAVRDRVPAGAPLVVMDKSEILQELAAKEREFKRDGVTIEEKSLEYKKELESAKSLKEREDGKLGELDAELARAKRLLASEAVTRPQVLAIEKARNESERETVRLSREIAACADQLKTQQAHYGELVSKIDEERRQCEKRLEETVLVSPRDAVVAEILKQPGELAHLGEVILRLADPSSVVVKAYFDMVYESTVKVGDGVSIRFEDGYRTRGKVQKVYPEALMTAPDFKRAYGPLERAVVAEIAPAEMAPLSRVLNTRARVVLDKMTFWPFR